VLTHLIILPRAQDGRYRAARAPPTLLVKVRVILVVAVVRMPTIGAASAFLERVGSLALPIFLLHILAFYSEVKMLWQRFVEGVVCSASETHRAGP
jgi:hypothetical protein